MGYYSFALIFCSCPINNTRGAGKKKKKKQPKTQKCKTHQPNSNVYLINMKERWASSFTPS